MQVRSMHLSCSLFVRHRPRNRWMTKRSPCWISWKTCSHDEGRPEGGCHIILRNIAVSIKTNRPCKVINTVRYMSLVSSCHYTAPVSTQGWGSTPSPPNRPQTGSPLLKHGGFFLGGGIIGHPLSQGGTPAIMMTLTSAHDIISQNGSFVVKDNL